MNSTEVMFRQGQPAAYALPYGYHPSSWNTVIQPSWWNHQSDTSAAENSVENLANTSASTASTASPPPMDDQPKTLHDDLYANAHVYGMANAHVHAQHLQYQPQQALQVRNV